MLSRRRVLLIALTVAFVMVFALGAQSAFAASPPAWSANLSVATPTAVGLDSAGNVYAFDSTNLELKKFNSSGVLQLTFSVNPDPLNPSMITGVCVDSAGNIYVADNNNATVMKYNSSGVYQSQFGAYGHSDGQFDGPFGIVQDASGNFYVTDSFNNRVQKFNSSGVYQSKFGTLGTGDGQFNGPMGICLDSSGNIYVSDYTNRVQKFNSSGVYQSKVGSSGTGNSQFDQPVGLAADSSNNIYVADYSNNRIQEFDSSLAYLTQWGTPGAGNGQFNGPTAIATGSAGKIYVADYGNGRVQLFAPSFTITASTYGNGTVTPAGASSVVGGGSLAYTIAANPGNGINGVWVDGVYKGPLTTYTFTNVTAPHTIYASFYPVTSTPASSPWSLVLGAMTALGVAAVAVRFRHGVGGSAS